MQGIPLAFLNQPDSADRGGETGGLRGLISSLGQTGRFFTMGEQVYILSQDGHRVEPLKTSPEAAGQQLAAEFLLKITNDDGEDLPLPPHCRSLGMAVQARTHGLLPEILSVVRGPVFHIEGDRLVRAKDGLDPVRRELVLASALPGVLPPAEPGYPHLHALFSGLKFVDQTMHDNLVGILCAMFCRTGLSEFPMILIDSSQKSSGKTVAARTLCYLLTGREPSAMTYTGSEADFEVKLGALALEPGPHPVFVDNVRAKQGAAAHIRSQAISAGVHSHFSMVHKMYKGQVPLFDPIFILTMNGARVEGDLADKAVTVSVYRPIDGQSHRMIEPYPPALAKAHRLEIVAEVFAVLEKIRIKPVTGLEAMRFYQFEQIAVGAAAVLGLEASFSSERVRTADAGIDELFGLLQSDFPRGIGTERFPISEVVAKILAEPRLRECNEILRNLGRSVKGMPDGYRGHLLNYHHRRTYRWREQVYTLVVEGDDLTLKQ